MPGNQHFAWLMALMLILTLDLVGCDIGRRQNAGLMGKWTAKCKVAADLLASIKDVPSAKLASPGTCRIPGRTLPPASMSTARWLIVGRRGLSSGIPQTTMRRAAT